MKELTPVINVDPDKCVNCHACISACPVKYCNDGSGDHVTVNHNLCIGCGSCIAACMHQARTGIDDTPQWLQAVQDAEPMVAISAPALAANFPQTYEQVHGWLDSLGVEAFFDVSFGAELTVKSYMEYIRTEKPQTVIAQPCPAIVSYIELYRPELLPYLAPADSPMLHTLKMIRTYYPQYRDHKILVLSPCLAKRREFDAAGLGDYNVTYASLIDYLREKRIDITTYPPVSFTGKKAERAVSFSSPGGLQKTVARESGKAAALTRKIEGTHTIYPYLDKLPEMIRQGHAPLLVDCLNCEMGCNGGPGTVNQEKSPDEVEAAIEARNQAMQKQYRRRAILPLPFLARRRIQRALSKYWKKGLYTRSYENLTGNNHVQIPSREELQEIYRRMHKFKDEDFLNCRACGYGSCEVMATAIHNGLNRAENCFHYAQSSRMEMTGMIFESIRETTDNLAETIRSLTEGDQKGQDEVSIQDIAAITREIRSSIEDGLSYVKATTETMEMIRRSNEKTGEKTQALNEQIAMVSDILNMISSITAQTKIIAFNAELEASAAKEGEHNFKIVAAEIRRLADNTDNSTGEIKEQLQGVQESSRELALSRKEEQENIARGSEITGNLESIFRRLTDYSAETDQKIDRAVEAQVKTFEKTIGDLRKVGEKIDQFNS